MNMRNKYLKNYPLIVIMHTLSSVLGLAIVYLFGVLIDDILLKQKFDLIYDWAYLVLFLVIISQVLSFYYYEFSNIDKSQENWKILMKKSLEQLLSFSSKRYGLNEQSYYFNTIIHSASAYADTYTSIHIDLIANIFFVCILLVTVTFLDGWFLLIFVIFIITECACALIPSKLLGNEQKQVLEKRDNFTVVIKNIIDHKREINILNADNVFIENFDDKVEQWYKLMHKYKFLEVLILKIPKVLTQLFNIIYFLVAVLLIKEDAISIGLLLVGYQYLGYLGQPVFDICDTIIRFRANKENIDRINDLLEDDINEDKVYSEDSKYIFELDQINLYADYGHNKLLYKCDSLKIKKNTFNIIRGRNGTGKSFLLNIISGNTSSEYIEGNIVVDKEMKSLGYLTYPHIYIDGSFKTNLFGIVEKDELMNILNISQELRNKIIHINPLNLSFGEQQKISLLRILSMNSKVLFLDEPMSNLDRDTQFNLKNYLRLLKGKHTIFVIMHDKSLDDLADNILKIDNEQLTLEGF